MTSIANTAIIPTRASDLYDAPGLDLIVAETEDSAWQHVEWLPAPEGTTFEDWDWRAQLLDAGWLAFTGDVEHGAEYDTVRIERR